MHDNENEVIDFLFKSTNEDLYENNKYLLKELIQQNDKLKQVLFVDEITTLNNVNKFKMDIEQEKYDSIALYDIKDMKLVNNLYGKSIGNKILQNMSSEMIRYSQDKKLNLYRINFDIIAVTKSESMNDNIFIMLVYKLQEILNKTNYGYDIYINTRLAIVLHEDKVLEKAIFVLDYINTNKKDRVIYSKELKLEENIEMNLLWIRKIKKSINSDSIIPYFQPIYNNKTETYEKFEALIRLKDEYGGIISPGIFLEISKKAKIYKQLTEIMIYKTFDIFYDKDYIFSINLTVDDILDINLRNYILNKLKNFPNPKNVVFELVETEGIENFVEVKSFIDEIKMYGAKLAIDDFGTGYSNLFYLVKLDIDILKIDGSIIKKIIYDEDSLFVTKTILYLSQNMCIDTIAEYVENEEIYNKIKDLGIDYSQGYYFSPPVSEQELYRFMCI